jgi:Fe-S oxidoreductase
MTEPKPAAREGSLDAPTRHPLAWRSDEFYDQGALETELERVFHICHGCRRCVSLCHAFPTLFDLVDESKTMEVDGVAKSDFAKVVDQCYLCDLCYQTKCPYVPPHEWNVDFPHLMLRAKAVKHKQGGTSLSSKILSSTTAVAKLATIPVVVEGVNAANRAAPTRALLEKTLGVHRDAVVPEFYRKTARRRLRPTATPAAPVQAAGRTRGKVVLFLTCYGNYNMPRVLEDLAAVLSHNGIPYTLLEREQCCGMPKLELGDLESVDRYKRANLPLLFNAVIEGYDVIAPIPSCVLMFKQELPLMYPDESMVQTVKTRVFDPFEYLMLRHQAGLLKTDFKKLLGKVAYHAPCHQRVQNIGPKTRDLLKLIPGTQIDAIERCSGHDGTYGVKRATYELSRMIAKPVVQRVAKSGADHFASDCPMAAAHIAAGVAGKPAAENPISLLRLAYGI